MNNSNNITYATIWGNSGYLAGICLPRDKQKNLFGPPLPPTFSFKITLKLNTKNFNPSTPLVIQNHFLPEHPPK